MRILSLVILVVLCANSATWAGDGLVALQTADPSCPDDSTDIYVDCGNGTVTDNRTGLVWLQNANCYGLLDWHEAVEIVANLSDVPASSGAALGLHDCGLSDGSSPGEWRLPSQAERNAMVSNALGQGGDPDCIATPPTITNDSGQECWVSGPSSFSGVVSSNYGGVPFAPFRFLRPGVIVDHPPDQFRGASDGRNLPILQAPSPRPPQQAR
ncbi:MAG: DUF1566 domain-containing protein [Acidobacteria bacterium]|nr:DUF1566 domain-containing protein [Acidobacteriota bacterium]